MSDGYNGYKNYATWNVCLWCDNEYSIYRAATFEFGQKQATPDTAERFVREWYPDGTPDMQTEPVNTYDEVDWEEVAENFNAE